MSNLYQIHCFVCTRCTPKGSGNPSPELGGQKLRDELKQMAKEQVFNKKIRINASGCLGHCEHGLNAVIYPQGEWHTDLTVDDTDKLLARLIDLDKKS